MAAERQDTANRVLSIGLSIVMRGVLNVRHTEAHVYDALHNADT